MRARIVCLAVALSAALAAGCEKTPTEAPASAVAPAPALAAEWKVASAFSSSLPVLGTAGPRVAERLAALSGGRVKLQVFDPGALVAPLELFDAVSQGTIDAGFSSPASWFDRMPAVAFFAAPPFAPDSVEFLTWLYEGKGLAAWRELYGEHNVVPVPCGYMPPEGSGWFRQEVTGTAGLKGLKIHQFGPGGLVLQKLGVQVLTLAAEDLVPALERGILDGAQVSVPSIDARMGLGKVAKHYYFPGWQQPASVLELIISKARWDALSETDRLLIETVCRDSVATTLAQGELAQSEALASLKKQGVQVHYWSDEQLQVFRNAYEDVLKELRIKDAAFKRVHDAYQAFRGEYGDWAKLSRLPRGF